MILKANDPAFFKQWQTVLAQAVPLVEAGATLKDALLAFRYWYGDSPRNWTNQFRVIDQERGIIIERDSDATPCELFWKVEAPDGIYRMDTICALCPDGTMIFYP